MNAKQTIRRNRNKHKAPLNGVYDALGLRSTYALRRVLPVVLSPPEKGKDVAKLHPSPSGWRAATDYLRLNEPLKRTVLYLDNDVDDDDDGWSRERFAHKSHLHSFVRATNILCIYDINTHFS